MYYKVRFGYKKTSRATLMICDNYVVNFYYNFIAILKLILL